MAFIPRLGDNSWFAIARQVDNETPIEKVGDFVEHRFPFTSLGLELDSELQASEAIAGRRSDTRDQQGQLWGSGPIETQLYIDQMDEFWRAIINSDEPSADSKPATIAAIADETLYEKGAYANKIEAKNNIDPYRVLEVPGQIKFTLTATTSNTLEPDANLGTVSVEGQRRVGIDSKAFIPMKEENLAFTDGVATTSKYFTKVDKITLSKEALANTEIEITAISGQSKFTYKNKDDIFPGWTMQLVRGKIPAVAEGAVPVNSTLTIGENVRLSMDILAQKFSPFKEIGTVGEAPKITNALKDKPFVPDVFYPNWGGLLEVEDACLIFTNLTLNINQNLDFLPGIKANRFRLPVAPTGERRNVTLNATVYYEFDESKDRWAEVFQDNAARQLKASCYYWNEIGKEFRQTFSMPVSYLTASPRIGVDSRGPITRELAFKGVPMSDDKPDEIEIEIVKDTPA